MKSEGDLSKLKEKIHVLLTKYYVLNKKNFIPGKTPVQYAGAVYDEREIKAMVDSILKGWFGLATEGEALEEELATYLGAKKAFLTNSGSSADILAIASLMSKQFSDRLQPGDEVITPACTFPTVVASIYHNRLKPVFVDVDIETLNPRPEDIERAIGPKTKLLFLVHQLGNPNDMDPIMRIARDHNLYVIEDNCDALGATYKGKKTGTFGILSTESFYPAHHMTTAGEGGAVFLNDLKLLRIVQSIRDWGRGCWCGAAGSGPDGVCGVRFNYKIDDIPYDHKYLFTHIGYNLKPVEIQAAMGRIQLKKVPEFIKIRKKNFQLYQKFFKQYEKFFILAKATPHSDPSWFSFPLTIRPGVKFDRLTITRYLENHMIQTRPLFTGNILRQPAFSDIKRRVIGDLANSELIHRNTFFIGIYPGIGEAEREYVFSIIERFLSNY